MRSGRAGCRGEGCCDCGMRMVCAWGAVQVRGALMRGGAADGVLHPKEDEFLAAVAARFGFSDSEFRYFRARFVTDSCSPYDVLRLSPDATDAEVKAQYRKLVRDNHPDRLMANGVPAEFLELSTRKVAAINVAYETIARERGL